MQLVEIADPLPGEDEAHIIWLERSIARIIYNEVASAFFMITLMYSSPFGKSPFAKQTSANLEIIRLKHAISSKCKITNTRLYKIFYTWVYIPIYLDWKYF